MNVTLRINKPETLSSEMTAQFNGPKATVKACGMVFAENGTLRSAGPDTGRRFVPEDPVWWLPFIEEDAPKFIDVTGELRA